MWRPNVQPATLYSKILDEKFDLKVTVHALRKIDAAGGFDRYILNTHPNKMMSRKGMEIRLLMRKVMKGLEEGRDLAELKEEFGPKPPVDKRMPQKREYTNRFYFDWKGPRKQTIYC